MKRYYILILLLVSSIAVLNAQDQVADKFMPKLPSEAFIGRIFDSKSINENAYRFANVEQNPITVSFSLLAKSQTFVPSFANMQAAIKKGITEAGSPGQNQSFSYIVKEVKSIVDLEINMGQKIDVIPFFGYSATPRTRKTMALVAVEQIFLSLYMDQTDDLCVNPDDLSGYDKDQLVYMNSVSFGRKAFVIIESDESFGDVKSAINYMMRKAMNESVPDDAKLEALIHNSYIRIMNLGNHEIDDSDPHNPLSGLANYMMKKVDADDFGVPVSFTACYLKDGSVFQNRF